MSQKKKKTKTKVAWNKMSIHDDHPYNYIEDLRVFEKFQDEKLNDDHMAHLSMHRQIDEENENPHVMIHNQMTN